MDLKLTGKNAIVCAGSAGIGKAIALGLASEGVNVSIFARDPQKVASAKAELIGIGKGRVLASTADLLKPDDVKRVLDMTAKEFGSIDILINNQGGPVPGKASDISEENIDTALEVNLKSVLLTTRYCLPMMAQKKWGRIINILSTSAKEPIAGLTLSNMARPAVLGFAKTVATEYASSGITVNSILPGPVLTDRARTLMKDRATKSQKTTDQIMKETLANIPVGYMAGPEEIANVACFLCSPLASYVTGTALQVDGGVTRGLL